MSRKITHAEDIELTPLASFDNVAKEVFSQSKQESDKKLAKFQVSNRHKREKSKKLKG
jgi:hypothetical protein